MPTGIRKGFPVSLLQHPALSFSKICFSFWHKLLYRRRCLQSKILLCQYWLIIVSCNLSSHIPLFYSNQAATVFPEQIISITGYVIPLLAMMTASRNRGPATHTKSSSPAKAMASETVCGTSCPKNHA